MFSLDLFIRLDVNESSTLKIFKNKLFTYIHNNETLRYFLFLLQYFYLDHSLSTGMRKARSLPY